MGQTRKKAKKQQGAAIDWPKVGELVRTWAGSDQGSDDVWLLLSSMGVTNDDEDSGIPDHFWEEFSRRITEAFSTPATADLIATWLESLPSGEPARAVAADVRAGVWKGVK